MKTMKLIFLMLLFALTSNIYADELQVAGFTIQPGESKSVSVELINPDHAYIALEFQLKLPSGLSIAKTDDGKWNVAPNSDRLTGFTLDVNEIGDSQYQFLIYTTDLETPIAGTTGEIFTMILAASTNAETGLKQGVFSEQLFVIDDEGVEPADKLFDIHVGGMPGDVNNDEQITVADVTALVNIIQGKDNIKPYQYNHYAADVDGKDGITEEDVPALVNMILNQ